MRAYGNRIPPSSNVPHPPHAVPSSVIITACNPAVRTYTTKQTAAAAFRRTDPPALFFRMPAWYHIVNRWLGPGEQVNPELFGCPVNLVGTVVSNACWDSHIHEETSWGSCVACSSSGVDKLCEQAFPTQCANGGCSNSWYPGASCLGRMSCVPQCMMQAPVCFVLSVWMHAARVLLAKCQDV